MPRGLVLALSLLVASCSGPSTPEDYLALGRAAADQGDSAAAVLYYKNALQLDRSFLPARFELGMLYGELGNLLESERFLIPVVEGGFARELAVPALADAYFKQDKVFALDTLLGQQTALPEVPALSLQLALFQILWLAREGQPELAFATLAALGAEAQSCQRCLYTRAYLESFTQPAAAMVILERLVTEYPSASQAHLLLGQLALSLRDPRRAYKYFARFKRLQPLASYADLLLALSALQMDDRSAANQHVDQLLAHSPKQPVANHIKALLSFAEGNYEAAYLHAEQSTTHGLKTPANFLVAGVSAYQLANPEIAYQQLRKASVFYPDNAELQRLLLSLQLEFGDLAQAQASYLKQDLRSVQDLLFGNVMAYRLIKSGQFSAANSLLSSLANTAANHPALRLQTQVLRSQLDPSNSAGAADFSVSAEVAHNADQLATILLLLQSGAHEKALTHAQAWLAQSPEEVDALNALAYVSQQSADLVTAQRLYEKALQLNPENTPSLFFAAEQATRNGDNALASATYQQLLSFKPTSLAALQGLLRMTFARQYVPDFEALLAPLDYSSLSDDQMVAIADTLFRWQKYAKLEELLRRYQGERQWSDMLWMVWLKNSYFNAGVENFLEGFESYHRVNVQSDHVLFALSVLEQQGKWQLALDLIASLNEQMQRVTAIELTRAVSLLELGQGEAAQRVVDSLQDQEEISSSRLYVLGRLQEQRGDLAQAANYLTAHHAASPGFNSVTHLANVLLAAGRTEDLLALVERYLADNPSDDSTRLALALKVAPTHPDVALAILQEERADWLVLRSWELSYNVAWLYLKQGLFNDAQRYSANAVALKPDSDQVKALHGKVLLALEVPQI